MKRLLLISGLLLFLIGLLNGALIGVLPSKYAMSSHLAGLQHGMVLMIFAAIWHYIHLSPALEKAAVWLNIGGLYLLWLALLVAAFMGLNALAESGAIMGISTLASLVILIGVAITLYGAIQKKET